jgi:hypothetical protein
MQYKHKKSQADQDLQRILDRQATREAESKVRQEKADVQYQHDLVAAQKQYKIDNAGVPVTDLYQGGNSAY